jgi:outer membrane protein OmpA-like peptidoglycan-associated protein
MGESHRDPLTIRRRSRETMNGSKWIAAFLGAVGFAAAIHGQGTTSAEFLKMPVGARQSAMGGVFTGVGDDAYTVFWNPAGIGRIRNWQVAGSYTRWFADLYNASFIASKQFRCLGSRKTGIGLGIFYQGMNTWDNTEGNEPPVTASDMMGILTVGQRLDWLSGIWEPLRSISEHLYFGSNLKMMRSKLAETSASAVAADVGLLIQTGRFPLKSLHLGPFHRCILSAGFAVLNLGTKMKFLNQSFPLPLIMREGVSLRLLSEGKAHQLLLATDVCDAKDSKQQFGLGVEYWYRDMAGIRLGYRTLDSGLGRRLLGMDVSGLSYGLCFKWDGGFLARMGLVGFSKDQIDFSSSDFGNVLGSTYNGSFMSYPTGPEPFRMLLPINNKNIRDGLHVDFKWERTIDPDPCDDVRYCLAISNDSTLLDDAMKTAQKGILPSSRTDGNKKHFTTIITSRTDTTLEKILDPPGDYFWTVVAFDSDTNTCIAHGSPPFRIIHRLYPDLQAELYPKTIAVTRGDTIAVTQGNTISIVAKVKNVGLGAITDSTFRVVVWDSLLNKGSTRRLILDTLVTRFNQDSITFPIAFPLKWSSDVKGKYRLNLIVDSDMVVPDTNRINNIASMMITVGKLIKVMVQDTVNVETRKYKSIKVPVVPMVFFPVFSDSVYLQYFDRNAYYGTIMLNDTSIYAAKEIQDLQPTLKVIARRLKDHPELRILIKGYIDTLSREDESALAIRRAVAVKKILVEILRKLGADSAQVVMENNHDFKHPLIDQSTPNSTIESKWIQEENRRVELEADTTIDMMKQGWTREKIEKILFGPVEILVNEHIPNNSVVFSIDSLKAQEWNLSIWNNLGLPVRSMSGDGLAEAIKWDCTDSTGKEVAFNQTYYCQIDLTDTSNVEYVSEKKPFFLDEYVIIQEEIFSLAEFDTTTPTYSFYLGNLGPLAKSICENDSVMIQFIGHCDRIGSISNPPHLVDLSENRAKWLRKEFLRQLKNYMEVYCRDKTFESVSQRVISSPVYEYLDSLQRDCKDTTKIFLDCCSYYKPLQIPLLINDKKVNIYLGNNQEPAGRMLNRRIMIIQLKKPNHILKNYSTGMQ